MFIFNFLKNNQIIGIYLIKGLILLEGEKIVLEAIQIFQQVENPLAESKCWTRLGIACFLKGNLEEAESKLKTSVEKSRACFFQYGEATALFELGKLYHLKKQIMLNSVLNLLKGYLK